MCETLFDLKSIARRWGTTPKKALRIIERLPVAMATPKGPDRDYQLVDGALLWVESDLDRAERLFPGLTQGKAAKALKTLRRLSGDEVRSRCDFLFD